MNIIVIRLRYTVIFIEINSLNYSQQFRAFTHPEDFFINYLFGQREKKSKVILELCNEKDVVMKNVLEGVIRIVNFLSCGFVPWSRLQNKNTVLHSYRLNY